MRHQRRRDGVFNLVARELLFAHRNNLAIYTDAGRRVGHQQQVAAVPFDKLNQPTIECGKRRIGHAGI
jgi:hypothetical protein